VAAIMEKLQNISYKGALDSQGSQTEFVFIAIKSLLQVGHATSLKVVGFILDEVIGFSSKRNCYQESACG
jgi:hypothetical protein